MMVRKGREIRYLPAYVWLNRLMCEKREKTGVSPDRFIYYDFTI